MKKRILSMLLAIVMVATLMPTMNITAEAAGPHSNHCLCGTTHQDIGDHNTFSTVDFAQAYTGQTSGTYYLTSDKTLPAIKLTGDLTICLNGNTISFEKYISYGFQLNGHTLTITDCKGTGKVELLDGSTKIVYADQNNSTFNLYGGTVSGSSWEPGFYVESDISAAFNQYGGTLTSSKDGITICGNCTFAQYAGTISATDCGIIFWSADGTLTLKTMPVFTGSSIGIKIYMGTGFNRSKIKFDGNSKLTEPANPVVIGTNKFTNGTITVGWEALKITDFSKYFVPVEGAIITQNSSNELEIGPAPYVISKGSTEHGSFEVTDWYYYNENDIIDSAFSGDTIYVHPKPDDGYIADSVTYSYTTPSGTTTRTASYNKNFKYYSFYMPSYPVTIDVTFVVSVSSVTLDATSKNLTIDDTFTLTPTVLPENAANKNVNWSTSNQSVATVNDGVVTAIGEGAATITATAADGSGVSAACTVTVNAVTYTITKADAENGTVTVNETTATEGEEVTITATPAENYAVNTVTVKDASNNDVAVTDNGNGTYSFTMPAKAVTVSVTFRLLIHQHILCQTNGCTLDHNGDADGVGHDAVHFVPVSTQAELQYYATNGGSVYLKNSIELAGTINVTGNLTLCLNGHTLKNTADNTRVINIDGGTLNLTDCGSTGTITGGSFTRKSMMEPEITGSGVRVKDDGTFHMYGGTITGNSSIGGGAVAVGYNSGTSGGSTGTFHMYGGTISNNQSKSGGGIFVREGSFTMHDGTISDNAATGYPGGGGVYVQYTDTFTMHGGTISGNTASGGNGGGVFGGFIMTGGTISDNTASGDGGGVAGTVTMTGGCIENNTATNGGNSVSGSLKISGSPEISGDVHLGSSGKITITGPLDLPDEYKTISVYSSKDEQHVAITAGASTNGVITNGTQSIFVPKDTVNTRFHVHDGEVCQESTPTVTFDPKGGSPTPVTQTLPFENGKATKPAEDPTRDGHVFSHWCDNEFCTNYTNCPDWSFNTVITESKTLYAIWEPFSVTVTSGPGKLTAVASPSPEEPADDAYQWYKVVERDTGFTVTPEFLNDGNGFDRYGCSYTDSKWMTNQDYFNRRFMIYMNSGDTLTVTFDSAPGTMFLYGCNLGTFTGGEQQDESNAYVFTAPQGDGGTTTRDIYVLLFFGEAPAMTAVYNGTAFEAVEDQDDDNASLNTAGLPSGRYVCKVTWAEPTQDNYAGIYALSAPVSYTATYTITKADTSNGIVSVDKSTAAEGETVTITATPDSGYEVDTVAVTKAAGGESVGVSGTGNVRTFTMPAEAVAVSVTFKKISTPATDSGTSFPSNTTSKTEKNEDGSVTTTTTNQTTGTVTETTKTADGTTGTTVTDKSGNITEISAKVPAAAVNAAEKAGKPVSVPVEVPATKSSEEALPVKVDVPTGGAAVEIPVETVTPGTVVVIVAEDGTEQVVRTSSVSENGVVVKLERDATVKVVDMSRDFKDVHPVKHWATDAIDFVAARGIFNGTSADTFTPNGSMTRQAMWMTLARMSGEEPADMAAAREWAVENAVSDGSNPLSTVTRQQYVAMLWRWAVAEGMDVSAGEETNILSFTDANKISDYAVEAFQWACSEGIVGGYDDGSIRALTNASRAHAAAMMMRFCASTVN